MQEGYNYIHFNIIFTSIYFNASLTYSYVQLINRIKMSRFKYKSTISYYESKSLRCYEQTRKLRIELRVNLHLWHSGRFKMSDPPPDRAKWRSVLKLSLLDTNCTAH